MPFSLFEDSEGEFTLEVGGLSLVWENLDAEDALNILRGLASSSADFINAKAFDFAGWPDCSDWSQYCNMQRVSDRRLVLNEKGFSDDLSETGRFLLDLMFHSHVGDLEIYGKF